MCARTGKRSVGRPPPRWTDDIERVFGTRYKRPMSSRGRLWVDMMMAQWRALGFLPGLKEISKRLKKETQNETKKKHPYPTNL
ncbi:jg6322 [Pararge aegeria aegeria]|uniref:Jg6322 protein n=1 Tax=Pararge aegeria aegeria TaxID=348720 RepID=A0A8S4RCF1_9NEOP|nr:jg6322 [Pararge aegeria aegeria]